jgi:hypothetical protein
MGNSRRLGTPTAIIQIIPTPHGRLRSPKEGAPVGGDGGRDDRAQFAERIELGLFTLRWWEKCACSLLAQGRLLLSDFSSRLCLSRCAIVS